MRLDLLPAPPALLGTGAGGCPPLPIAPHVLRTSPFPGETTRALKDHMASPRKMPEPAILRPLLATAHSDLEPTPGTPCPKPRSRDRPQRKMGKGVRPVCAAGGAQRPLSPSLPSCTGRPGKTCLRSLNRSRAAGKGPAGHSGDWGFRTVPRAAAGAPHLRVAKPPRAAE